MIDVDVDDLLGMHEEHQYWLNAGSITVALDEEEFEKLGGDKPAQIKAIEAAAGASIAMVVEHTRYEGQVRCAAITKSGYQCKLFLRDSWRSDFAGWHEARKAGGYCHIHSQRTMNVEGIE